MIIQAAGGSSDAAAAFTSNGQADGGTVSKRLSLVNGVAVQLKAKWIMRLAKVPGLTVTPDAKVETTAFGSGKSNNQLWPYVSGDRESLGVELASGSERADDRRRRFRARRGQAGFRRSRLPAGELQLDHAKRAG